MEKLRNGKNYFPFAFSHITVTSKWARWLLKLPAPTVYPGADQRKHQSSASLAFVRGIYRWPVNSPHKGPVTRNMFSFDDVIMIGEIKSRYSERLKQMLSLYTEYIPSNMYTTLLCYQFIVVKYDSFTHILQGCFTGIGEIVWDWYQTTTKHKLCAQLKTCVPEVGMKGREN